jgi:hypothetical protein
LKIILLSFPYRSPDENQVFFYLFL